MIVLIYGSQGWIGNQLVNLLNKNKTLTIICSKNRVNDTIKVENDIQIYKPDRVISLIGRTSGGAYNTIDYLENPSTLNQNLQDNLYSTISLSLLTKKYGIHLTSLGTGCIFSYDEKHQPETSSSGFKENDLPNFFGSNYSIVKGYTDRILHQIDNVLNVRIRMPITNIDCSKNFISKIIRYEKICSMPNSMTVLPDLLPCLINLIKQGITGTINLTNPGYITHNEILDMYCEIIDPEFSYKNFTIKEQNKVLLGKRSNNNLNTEKLESFFPEVPDIKTSVRNVLLNWKK